ncbi:Ankyrin repeat, partial [Melia azedarach]
LVPIRSITKTKMERNNHGAAEERQRPLTNEDQRRLITKEELQAIMTLPGMELQKKAPEKPKEPEKPEKPKEPERPEEPEKPMPVGLDSLHGSGSCPQLKSSDGFGSCPHQILGSCPPQNLGLLQLQSSEVAYELKSSEVSRLSTGMKLHVGPRLSTGMKPRRKMAVGLHRKRKGRRYRAGESSEDAIYKDYLDEQHTEVESSEDGKDWKGVEDLIGHHPEALTVNISDSKTIFHHIVNFTGDDIEAASEIDKLASKLNNPRTLEQQDSRGLTVLHLSAITGMKSASETLVKYHGNLPNAWSNDIWLPVHYAAYYGKKDTVQYLVSVTAKKNLVDINGARLISYLINSNLYDVALDILKENPAIGRDHIRSRKMVLKTLAGKPSAFASGTQLGCLRFIYNWIPVKKEKFSSIDQTNRNRSADVDVENVPCIKAMHDKKLTHLQSVEILRMICEGVAWNDPEIFRKNDKDIFETWLFLHTAAEIGISEFFNEIIIDYNDSLYQTNREGHHIFHLAVLHRQENVFNLIYGFRYLSDMLNMYDKSGNNMLHLAGRLVPSSKVAGAALQMQRELQWFKGS